MEFITNILLKNKHYCLKQVSKIMQTNSYSAALSGYYTGMCCPEMGLHNHMPDSFLFLPVTKLTICILPGIFHHYMGWYNLTNVNCNLTTMAQLLQSVIPTIILKYLKNGVENSRPKVSTSLTVCFDISATPKAAE